MLNLDDIQIGDRVVSDIHGAGVVVGITTTVIGTPAEEDLRAGLIEEIEDGDGLILVKLDTPISGIKNPSWSWIGFWCEEQPNLWPDLRAAPQDVSGLLGIQKGLVCGGYAAHKMMKRRKKKEA